MMLVLYDFPNWPPALDYSPVSKLAPNFQPPSIYCQRTYEHVCIFFIPLAGFQESRRINSHNHFMLEGQTAGHLHPTSRMKNQTQAHSAFPQTSLTRQGVGPLSISILPLCSLCTTQAPIPAEKRALTSLCVINALM